MRKDIPQKFQIGDVVQSTYPHWTYIGTITRVKWYYLPSGDYPVYNITPICPIGSGKPKGKCIDTLLSQCWIKKVKSTQIK
jgi:hypothetical protein